MTFSEYDSSRASGRPVEAYKFIWGQGSTDFYAYTDAERELTDGATTYIPVAIDRDRVKSDGGKSKNDLTIYCAADNPVVALFSVYPPDQAVLVQIRATHLADPDGEFVPIWFGRVFSVSTNRDGTAQIVCRPMTVAGRQAGLRRHWQIGCPLTLYSVGDGKCNASEAAATTTVVLDTVGTASVVMPLSWTSEDPQSYVGGRVKWTKASNTYSRTILRVGTDGRTLTLSGYATGLEVGDSVDVSLGCPHTMVGCNDLHSNIQNYGGQDWIPLTNPINTNPF